MKIPKKIKKTLKIRFISLNYDRQTDGQKMYRLHI